MKGVRKEKSRVKRKREQILELIVKEGWEKTPHDDPLV
jgi:hypothetical protein